MLPLPPFEWIAPHSLDEVVRALAEHPDQTMLVAGGTDVLPNLKYGLYTPRRVIGAYEEVFSGYRECPAKSMISERGSIFAALYRHFASVLLNPAPKGILAWLSRKKMSSPLCKR